jgi:hypothetical protein
MEHDRNCLSGDSGGLTATTAKEPSPFSPFTLPPQEEVIQWQMVVVDVSPVLFSLPERSSPSRRHECAFLSGLHQET